MITHPTAEELAAAVGRWIAEIRPQLDPRNAFLSRVAENAMKLIGRELAQGEAADAAAQARLAAVLGHDAPLASLVHELCEGLRSGRYDVTTPGLTAALRANALDQLAIDQPTYKPDLAGSR